MTVAKDLLKRKGDKVFVIGPDDTVLDAARRMTEHHIGALVVVDPDMGMVGLFTERQILARVVAKEKPPAELRVGEVMSANVAYCAPDTPIAECRQMMTHRRQRHLPVLQEGQLVGLISMGDIVAHEVELQQATIEYMHQYIYGRS
jgi:CBS domain-containing protein